MREGKPARIIYPYSPRLAGGNALPQRDGGSMGGVTRTKEPVMLRMAYLLLVLLLGGMVAEPPGFAPPAAGPAAAGAATAASAATPEPEFLKTFPRPPDQPASLLSPPPPLGPPPPDLEKPYFQQDPLLDPPWLGLIGLFADVDVGILK